MYRTQQCIYRVGQEWERHGYNRAVTGTGLGVLLHTSVVTEEDKANNGLVKPYWINSRVKSSHLRQAAFRPGALVLNLQTVFCCVQTCSDWSLTRAGGQTSGNWGCCWGTASRCPACWARSRRLGGPTPSPASGPASRLRGTRYILYYS